MSIFSDLNTLMEGLGIPVETGSFSDNPPAKYVILTPMAESFEVYADNKPQDETQDVRISLFHFGNFIDTKDAIVNAPLEADYTITDRRYIGFDTETGYHNYAIDVSKNFNLEKEDE